MFVLFPNQSFHISLFLSTRQLSLPISNLVVQTPKVKVQNEPILGYLPGSDERNQLKAALDQYTSAVIDVPICVGGQRLHTELKRKQVLPFDHHKVLATYSWATPDVLQRAARSAIDAKQKWERIPFAERIQIFLRAADLVAGKYRQRLNAATMLGQAKTVIQAEIDAACELADFLRFNAHFLAELLQYQPISPDSKSVRNTFRYRPLDGFVVAISPFNFTAIGGNLASAPTLMGNAVVWKPSDSAILSNYLIYEILLEAGIPDDVISFVPAQGIVFGDTINSQPDLAGINFTGSVATFKHLWKQVANNLDLYHNYPRLIGECGGKNFHFVHPTADLDTVVASTVRSAFEYSGQKCSACSRMYVPKSLWNQVRDQLVESTRQLKLGSPLEFDTFLSAVITEQSFDRVMGYLQRARASPQNEILLGGTGDKSVGYFIDPTIIRVDDPFDPLMCEELFAPLLTVYVYDDNQIGQTLKALSKSDYALTGAIFAQDQSFLEKATWDLRGCAGNFYVNDKSTGSVVGQQPFGGSLRSGTNDKAGGPHYLLRWSSPQNIKETFVPQTQITYPYMSEKQ